MSIVQQLLDEGAEPERNSADGSTVLTDACRTGYLEGVKLLVEHGANINNRCSDGTTCLLAALDYGHPSVVAYLLKQDSCEVNYVGRDGRCFLQRLVLADDARLFVSLKNRCIDLNKQSPVSCPLMLAQLGNFIGWDCARVLCNNALQEQLTERNVGSRC